MDIAVKKLAFASIESLGQGRCAAALTMLVSRCQAARVRRPAAAFAQSEAH